jgi:hypothetical protein
MNASDQAPSLSDQNAGWYAYLNGETKGPFEVAVLAEMLAGGLISSDTPVAKAGATEWQPASSVLSAPSTPPPLPAGAMGRCQTAAGKSLIERCKLIGQLPLTAKHWLVCGVAGLALLLVVPSMCGGPGAPETSGESRTVDEGRFWEDQAEKLARETTGGSKMCNRCSGTGRIQNSGGRFSSNAHPDPSERLREGADPFRCQGCNGEGTIYTQSGHVVICPDCSGRGQARSRTCDLCRGTGKWR